MRELQNDTHKKSNNDQHRLQKGMGVCRHIIDIELVGHVKD